MIGRDFRLGGIPLGGRKGTSCLPTCRSGRPSIGLPRVPVCPLRGSPGARALTRRRSQIEAHHARRPARWPSTESIAKRSPPTSTPVDIFVGLLQASGGPAGRAVPLTASAAALPASSLAESSRVGFNLQDTSRYLFAAVVSFAWRGLMRGRQQRDIRGHEGDGFFLASSP